MQTHDYNYLVPLNHNEVPAKVNAETGEITTFTSKGKKPNPPRDSTMQRFESTASYQRTFTKAWQLLETQTTPQEFKVAVKMSFMAKAYTNSLEPLGPDSTKTSLAEEFKLSYRDLTRVLEKLLRLGVYASFEVYNANEVYTKYWVFNPYLSFNGKTIKKDVATLFDKTFFALLGTAK
jgi:hypothetical protein